MSSLGMQRQKRIEELEAEKTELQAALREIMALCERFGRRGALAQEVREVARQALSEQRGGR